MPAVDIIGGGLAGASAAIAARLEGSPAIVWEQSRLPRHKVCGEFLSPAILDALHRLGCAGEFLECQPARIRRFELNLGRCRKSARLPEVAYGLSRYRLDRFLLDQAVGRGARVHYERKNPSAGARNGPVIFAGGRSGGPAPVKGERLFGFKAHFEGPVSDAVELFFFEGCYVGLNAIENGLTNVCGLGPERVLRRWDFEVDEMLRSAASLKGRMAPLARAMPWMHTGPLVFGNRLAGGDPEQAGAASYFAGDALSFVDPFTGSGQLCAVLTGTIAGRCAGRAAPVSDYLRECSAVLRRPFRISSLLRQLVGNEAAQYLAQLAPASWLFQLTRPRVATAT